MLAQRNVLAQRNFLSYASCITTRGTCPRKPAGPRRIKDTWHTGTPDLYFAVTYKTRAMLNAFGVCH